ncbi:multidrug resistance protein-like protein, partial [Leptotrombidium deliense]
LHAEIIKNYHLIDLCLTSFYIAASFLLFILSCFVDKTSDFVEFHDTDEEYKCPVQEKTLLSRLTFFWMFKYVILGLKTKIETSHFDDLCSDLKSEKVTQCYDQLYEKQIRHSSENFSLLSILWGLGKYTLYGAMFLEILSIAFTYLPPLILSRMIDFLQVPEQEWHGSTLAVVYALCSLFGQLADSHHQYLLQISAIKTKSSLIAAIYRKVFKLSPNSRKNFAVGDISNFMSVDTEEVYEIILWTPQLFGLPLRIIISLYLLYVYLGPSAFSVFLVLLVFLPISTVVSRKMDKLQTTQMELKDRRITQLTEVLNGVKVLKLYAWEYLFINRITETRAAELKNLLKTGILSSVFSILWVMTPTILACVCFTIYILTDVHNHMNAKTIFVSLSLFNSLRYPFALLPDVISKFIRARVSYRRLKKFLKCEEVDTECVGSNIDDPSVSVSIEDATFTWDTETENCFQLKDINLKVNRGSLVAVVGTVGSGKTALFGALIGSLCKLKGKVNVIGKQAYVAQQAWIQNETLRENITFVEHYDHAFYRQVVEACALDADIAILPGGDKTVIGERGINLSGGQKQRISLARAVYQKADVYYLDDPLSAVDAHVANHLFERVIGPTGMLNETTRIIATHNISILPNVDRIIVFKDGEIIADGTYEHLLASGMLPSVTVVQEGDDRDSLNDTMFSIESNFSLQSLRNPTQRRRQSSMKVSETICEEDYSQEETHEVGDISIKMYFQYLKKAGILITIVALLSEFGINACDVGANYWLSVWADKSNVTHSNYEDRMFRLRIYFFILAGEAVFVVFGTVLALYGGVNASRVMHKEMLYSVLRSPLSFFDVTPTGRVINRFSKDMMDVDFEVPFGFIEASTGASSLIIKMYIQTIRQLKHLEAISSSPVYTHFNESINGSMTIKAFSVESQFLHKSNEKVDNNNNCLFYQESAVRWLEVWMQFIGVSIIFTISLIVLLNRHSFSAGFAGLVLTYSSEVVVAIAWLVRITADLETHLVAAERIMEFSALSPEAEWNNERTKPSINWPQSGSVEFRNYSTNYRDGMPVVLDNVTFKVKGGEKVGVVGRTGAGKSSLTLALFRIIEAKRGTILIDGIDISRIGLHDLRTKLSIIPQDPFLFSVSLRENLDPFGERSDDDLWRALEDANLKDYVSSLAEALDYEVAEGGENFSAGQRQLLCLARALLRNSRILVMDEATAAVDVETDEVIQRTIRDKFKQCTVFTIAHRLNTVIDNDRIIVLSNGRIVEIGTPSELLTDVKSHFYAMAKEAGILRS